MNGTGCSERGSAGRSEKDAKVYPCGMLKLERRENKAGGFFQHPAKRKSLLNKKSAC
jgi:hypothetical protein